MFGIVALVKFVRFSRFPQTEGLITENAVSSSSDDSGNVFWPDVSFTYSVRGVEFASSRVYSISRRGYSSRAAVEKFCAFFATGTPVVVRYDPAEPSFAFLRNGPLSAIVLPLLLGAVFLAMGTMAHRF